MSRSFVLLLALMFVTFVAQAQEVAYTQDGKKVILYSNGTWKYAEDVAMTVDGKKSCEYWKDEYDEFANSGRRYLKTMKVGFMEKHDNMTVGDLFIELRWKNGQYFFLLETTGIDCGGPKSYVNIKLTNGEVFTLDNINPKDCNISPPILVLLSEDDFHRLQSSPIDKIKVQGETKAANINTITNPTFFMDYLPCIEVSQN